MSKRRRDDDDAPGPQKRHMPVMYDELKAELQRLVIKWNRVTNTVPRTDMYLYDQIVAHCERDPHVLRYYVESMASEMNAEH